MWTDQGRLEREWLCEDEISYLGKRGVGQGGGSRGQSYVYYQIHFLSVCGHFSLSYSADIRPARLSAQPLFFYIL